MRSTKERRRRRSVESSPGRFGEVRFLRTSRRCRRRIVFGVTGRWRRSAPGCGRLRTAKMLGLATGSVVALFPVAIGEHSCQHREQDAGAYDRLLAASPSFHHGAPVRPRNEVQLGLTMVKWIKGIEFVGALRGCRVTADAEMSNPQEGLLCVGPSRSQASPLWARQPPKWRYRERRRARVARRERRSRRGSATRSRTAGRR